MTRVAILVLLLAPGATAEGERPNIVWILSEDNSKHYLKLFDPAGAPAPNIEALGRRGVVFDRAFSASPVCSVARTTLMTACYGPRIGTQFHRKLREAPMPPGLRMFPAYLRAAGYHTTNNSKKDYNAAEGKDVWDASSAQADWRSRKSKTTPFFHMRTFGQSHESSLHFSEAQRKTAPKTDPDGLTPAPCHPDTPLFRHTLARYHDRMAEIDAQVGRLVGELEADGLLEDTFVFYFGDHGGVLPRSKGYLYESGLHVPLVVRIPEKWKQRAAFAAGSRTSGFVSFVDFGPTALRLAGVEVPEGVDGRPFLGEGVTREEVEARDEAFGHADRFDEKYELARSLRKGRWKYIRHFEGHYPDGLQNNYRYRMLAYAEWRELYRAGKLDAVRSRFFEPKGPESLYDLESDPHETRNLADDPAHAAVRDDLRRRLSERLKAMPDLSLYPESVLVDQAMDAPTAFGRSRSEEIGRLIDVADLSLLPFDRARPGLEKALSSTQPWERYWGLTACALFGKEAVALVDAARASLTHPELLVRARAAEFLALVGAEDPRPVFREALKTSRSHVETLILLNSVVFLRDGGPKLAFDFTRADVRSTGGEVSRRLEYLGW